MPRSPLRFNLYRGCLLIFWGSHESQVADPTIKAIEVLFEPLKSRGFNFEDVNLKDKEGLNRLLAVLTIAFCWVYHIQIIRFSG